MALVQYLTIAESILPRYESTVPGEVRGDPCNTGAVPMPLPCFEDGLAAENGDPGPKC